MDKSEVRGWFQEWRFECSRRLGFILLQEERRVFLLRHSVRDLRIAN